jgi:cation/acetate symporter
MIKAVLLIAATAIITVWVLGRFGFSLSGLLQGAVDNSPEAGPALLDPGLKYGLSDLTKIDFVSLSMALVLGTAGLPHVLIRFYTVPTSQQARKSVEWAIWLIGGFYLLTLVVGYGAAALVGPEAINAAPGKANSAAPLLAYELGGSVLLGVISGIAFATILAVVAGLTIASSATFAHDLYSSVFKRGRATPDEEVRVARWASIIIGVVAILGGILAYGQNIAFLVALAFAVAASANLPTILYSLFWSRFNTRGALWSIYGGLASALVLITFSPVVSGSPTAMITNPDVDFAFFPLANPGIVSIPLAFFLGWLGSVTSPERNEQKWAEVEVRSLTGHGVAEAVDH